MFKSHLPTSLKKLTLFEDFSEDLNAAFREPRRNPYPQKFTRVPKPSVGTALAKASLCLEQLSAAFLVDAKDFFQAYQPGWIWKDLVSLALTSRLLNSTGDVGDINNMLHAAGVAARSMPKLQTMEIWNGEKGNACVFRYMIADGFPILTWRSVWDLRLESRVVGIWESVSLEHSGQPLCVDAPQVPKGTIRSHAFAIDQLLLKQQILRPISLYQIRKEENKK